MRKVKIRLLAFAMAGAVATTTVIPSYPTVSVYAAEEQTQEINWTFSGLNGEKTESGIRLFGEGDSFGITDINKTDNYSVKAVLTQGSEDGAVGVVLGAKNVNEPSKGSVVANITPSNGEVRIFEFTSSGVNEIGDKHYEESLKDKERYAFEIIVKGGKITVKINDTVAFENVDLSEKANGNIGFISFKETMTVSDITINDVNSGSVDDTKGWKFTGNGRIDGDNILLSGEGDNIGISDIEKKDNYSVKTSLKQGDGDGNVGVVLGAKDSNKPKEGSVVVNVAPSTGAVRLFCFQGNMAGDMQKSKTFSELKGKETYDFDISIKQRYLTVKINNVKVIGMEISDTSFEGNVGLIAFNENMTASNFAVEDIEVKDATAHLKKMVVTDGKKTETFEGSEAYAVTVENSVDKLTITPTVEGDGTVTVGGKEAVSGKATEIVLKEGSQQIPVVVISNNGTDTKEQQIVNVLRKFKDSVYSVPTRPQYHYSPASAWCNDPNGMVYYKGEYHLFYQAYPDDTIWGPMHWAHAVSKDLIHWEELPMALYYQEDQGAMFSGSCVVDDENKSGLFGDKKGAGTGGLVAIYTQNNDGRGQDQAIAYSKDNGRTWIKYKGNPVLKWDKDHLKDAAFRDPKVFYHEESGKYMMVVAGGILRIYSSENLIDWKIESTYRGNNDIGNSAGTRIETECPDMFPLKADDGTTKWVVDEGGRYYRIGDFNEENGHWTFVQDKDSERYVMNFGPQAYAGVTYYVSPEDQKDDQKLQRRIMIQWASTWENGYCNNVNAVTGKWGYNGFFNLQTEMNVKKINGKYKLIQTPIEEYTSLRSKEATVEINKTIPKKTENSENLLSGVKAGQYEIVAEFIPKDGTKEVGFKLRTNESGTKETVVKYNVETKKVIMNGDKSGAKPEGQRKGDIVSDAIVTEQDGKVKLNIFVDESSVEVYAQDGQVTGALAIFPSVNSTGMEVYSEGGETDAKISLYPMNSIWADKLSGDNTATDLCLSTDSGSGEYNIGDKINVSASISPVKAAQEVTWKVTNNKGEKVKIVKEEKDELQLQALKEGAVTVTATTANGLSRSVDVFIAASSTDISLGNWNKIAGEWTISKNGNRCTGESSGDAFLMSGTKIDSDDYIFESDVIYHKGQAFALLFRGQDPNTNKAYAANVDTERNGGTSRIFTFGGGTGDIGKDANYNLSEGQKYHVKVKVQGNQFKVYIGKQLVLNVRDSKIDKNYKEGKYVGFNVFKGKVTFENMKVTPLEVKVPSVSEQLKLSVDQKANVGLTNMEENAYNVEKYSSDDTNIATVDDEGNIVAKKAGTVTITTSVTTFGREYTLKTIVTVDPKVEPAKPTETPSTDSSEKPKPDDSSSTTAKPAATKPVPTVKQPTYQKVSMRKIKVSWKKKSGAKGYVVYMKTGKGSYKKIKTVSNKTTSMTVNVKSGYSYKFKVKPIKNKTKKTYYKVYAAKAKNQGKTMKVTYRNISGYKGYTIYQKAGKGKYKAVKTTTKGGTITYTSKKVKVGTYYQYKIKGYKVVKGKKVYTTIKVKTVK